MDSGIYQIMNVTNGKVYVGSSKVLKSRRYTHFRDLRKGKHGNPYLSRAWNECGEESFHFSVLEYCAKEDLLEREAWWMDLLGTRDRAKGYNLWDARRHECSPETRAKLSAANSGEKNGFFGKKPSPETLAKLSAIRLGKPSGMKGKKHSPESNEKNRQAHLGQPGPNKGRFFGPHSPETKAKMSASGRGKKKPPRSEEWRQRQSEVQKGKPWSEARRAEFERKKLEQALE